MEMDTAEQVLEMLRLIDDRLSRLETLQIEGRNPGPIPVQTKFWNVKQAADFLNLTPSTVYHKCGMREIPHIKRGNRLYFERSALEEYLKGGARKNHSSLKMA